VKKIRIDCFGEKSQSRWKRISKSLRVEVKEEEGVDGKKKKRVRRRRNKERFW
jgi:hypothetical protein